MENIKKLADNCTEQIMTYPVITGAEKIKRAIKKNLLGQKIVPADYFSWPNAMLGEGLLAAFEATADRKYLAAVIRYLEQWKKSGYKINYVDNLMNGSLALWTEELICDKASILYSETEKEQILALCAEAAKSCADWARSTKKTTEGILAYRIHHANWIFADAVGMASPFLCRYGVQKQDEELLNLGILQIQAFLKNGMDRRTGLPYHGYDESSKIKYGIIGWGRACGWLMKGIAESVRWIPSRMREKRQLKTAFWALKDSAAKYQRRDGGFSWQLQAQDGPVDVSAGAMIGNAIWAISHKSEMKPETLQTLQQLEDSFLISVTGGEVRNCSGECQGSAEYPQVYGVYPWGTGSVLRFLCMKMTTEYDLKINILKMKESENNAPESEMAEKKEAVKKKNKKAKEKPEKSEKADKSGAIAEMPDESGIDGKKTDAAVAKKKEKQNKAETAKLPEDHLDVVSQDADSFNGEIRKRKRHRHKNHNQKKPEGGIVTENGRAVPAESAE